MNALIKQAAMEVEAVFHRVVPAVKVLGNHDLQELEHRCKDVERLDEFTFRSGAHIVRAAVALELEHRKGK